MPNKMVTIVAEPSTIQLPKDDTNITVTLRARPTGFEGAKYKFEWQADQNIGHLSPADGDGQGDAPLVTKWELKAANLRDKATIEASIAIDVVPAGQANAAGGAPRPDAIATAEVLVAQFKAPPATPEKPIQIVSLQRTSRGPKEDEILWIVIRNSTNNLSVASFSRFMDLLLCGEDPHGVVETHVYPGAIARRKASGLHLPFAGVDPYRLLKVAAEVFVQIFAGVEFKLVDGGPLPDGFPGSTLPLQIDLAEEASRFGKSFSDGAALQDAWDRYVESNVFLTPGGVGDALPYLSIIRQKLPDIAVVRNDNGQDAEAIQCLEILQSKLAYPFLLELIWSYWHEEAMLVQTMKKLTDRFQNRSSRDGQDPLANLEIDPLRPLNNLLWGYIQDEQHRLTVLRRAYEYDHHYGFSLHGKAVPELTTADRRSKFLESFHNLLYQCVQFYRQDDDTTIVADGFPVLNSIKETHYLLAQGAHNQYGDLPSTSRQEMLIEQWLLSRPEMREFLGGRVMVPYPEPWMDRVDAMKSLQSWTDASVVHFHDLGVYGEQILLSVRFGGWSLVNDHDQAATWARYFRPEIQGYIHAYRAVTGIDLSADIVDEQQAEARYTPPSVHLRNRLQPRATRPSLPPIRATTKSVT